MNDNCRSSWLAPTGGELSAKLTERGQLLLRSLGTAFSPLRRLRRHLSLKGEARGWVMVGASPSGGGKGVAVEVHGSSFTHKSPAIFFLRACRASGASFIPLHKAGKTLIYRANSVVSRRIYLRDLRPSGHKIPLNKFFLSILYLVHRGQVCVRIFGTLFSYFWHFLEDEYTPGRHLSAGGVLSAFGHCFVWGKGVQWTHQAPLCKGSWRRRRLRGCLGSLV